jgi:hypothetical protein
MAAWNLPTVFAPVPPAPSTSTLPGEEGR